MSFVFNTDVVPQAQRFDYFHAAAERSYVRGQYMVPDPTNFRGVIAVESFDGLNISRCLTSALTADIPRRDRLSAPDVLFLQIVLRGQTFVTQNGAEAVTNSGELTLLDTTQPYTVCIPNESDHLVLEIPRAELLSRISRIDRTYGQSYSARTPEGALAIGFLRSLMAKGPPSDATAASSLARQAVDVAALVLSGGDPETVRRLSSPASLSRLRLHHAVEDSLLAGFVSCEDVAGAAGISARYANILLGQEDTSLERLLMKRRLEKCRDSLMDHAESHRSISDIALRWGFNSPSHFARVFKDAYGTTAREFREAHRQQAPHSGTAA